MDSSNESVKKMYQGSRSQQAPVTFTNTVSDTSLLLLPVFNLLKYAFPLYSSFVHSFRRHIISNHSFLLGNGEQAGKLKKKIQLKT